MVCCSANSGGTAFEGTAARTDEAASRIVFDSAELKQEDDRTLSTSSLNAFDDGSESSTSNIVFHESIQ